MAKIKKPNEIEIPKTVCGLIYGQPGTGKTTLSLSAPNPILIDAENGVHRINLEHRKDTLQVDGFQDILNTLPELGEYNTIVFDTINEVLVHIENSLIKTTPKAHQSGKLNQYGYGLRSIEFKNLINRIKHLGKNIIFVAHDIESKDDDGKKEVRPDISGKASGELMKFMDFVGYIEMLGKKRTINFMPCSKYYAKNSLGLDDFIEIPNVSNIENTFLTEKIINPTIERRKSEQANFGLYQEIIDSGTTFINENDVNIAFKLIQELPVIDDSKAKLWTLLKNKADDLKLIFNKTSKLFEEEKPEEDPHKDFAEHETGVPGQESEVIPAKDATEQIFDELTQSPVIPEKTLEEIKKEFSSYITAQKVAVGSFAIAYKIDSKNKEQMLSYLNNITELDKLIKDYKAKKKAA